MAHRAEDIHKRRNKRWESGRSAPAVRREKALEKDALWPEGKRSRLAWEGSGCQKSRVNHKLRGTCQGLNRKEPSQRPKEWGRQDVMRLEGG